MNKQLFSKLFFTALAILTIGTNSFAQESKYGKDSVNCVKNISLYRDFFKQRSYQDAIPYWREAMSLCPAASEYIYVDGITLVKVMMQAEKDKTKFNALLDTLMMVYDKRIEYFGKEGFVLGRKGFDMAKMMPEKQEEAYQTLQRSYLLQKTKMEASSVDAYFMTALELLKKNKISKEEALEVYERVSEVLEANKNAAADEGYDKAQENIEGRFSEIADCPSLINLYGPKFKANPNDVALLRKITKLMDKRDCASDQLYFDAAINLDKQDPSADSKAKIAKMHLSKGNNSEAQKFYTQAIDMESDPTQKAQYHYELSLVNLKQGQNSAARSNAQKAIQLRPNWGKPYIVIGDAYVGSARDCGENEFEQKAVYWVAVDKYSQAKSVDAGVTADANTRIATYSKYFPAKADAFFYNFTDGSSYTVGCWINESTKVRTQ
jgi:tetratricopeptide (TPR) repeat protein